MGGGIVGPDPNTGKYRGKGGGSRSRVSVFGRGGGVVGGGTVGGGTVGGLTMGKGGFTF